MTTGPGVRATAGRRGWIVAGAATTAVMILLVAYLLGSGEPARPGPTVGEKLSALAAERAALQAQADGEARIDLIGVFRTASLLLDALALRHESDRERPFEALSSAHRELFGEVEQLDIALRESLAMPGDGSRRAARAEAQIAQGKLDRLAGDGAPLVLQFSPKFVPPRRAGGELRLDPRAGQPPAIGLGVPSMLPLGAGTRGQLAGEPPVVPRYAPAFADPDVAEPPVEIEIAAVGLDDAVPPPMLSIGSWRNSGRATPLRLHFSVPRSAFATDADRTTFVTGRLSFRRGGHTATIDLLFVVLPDHPGAFALDQKVQTLVPEATTLVSPEILARADAGQTKSVRRCFDPPPGTRFDKSQRRVVEVERLGWLEDVGDQTLNDGKVEFASDEGRDQICIVVTARPVNKDARTATIGRFEATIIRDRPEESALRSGVRALDWREPVKVPLDPQAVEWKFYLRLLGDINREFGGHADAATGPLPDDLPFLRIERDAGGRSLILRADPTAEP